MSNDQIKIFDIIDEHILNICHLKNLLYLSNDIQDHYFIKITPSNKDFDLITSQYNRIQRLLHIIDYIGGKIITDMNKITEQLNQFMESNNKKGVCIYD